MKESGAIESPINFVRKLDGEGYLESFEEKGRVDLGSVAFPGRANTNGAYVLSNGTPSLVSTELTEAVDASHDLSYLKLKQKYPELQIWESSAGFIGVNTDAQNGQRFIFSYPILNGCHACDVLGVAWVAFDFSGDGIYNGTKLLKIVSGHPVH